MTRQSKTLILCALFSVAGALDAQKSIKIDVDLVMVNATVTDGGNRLITDLKRENFQLFEDRIEQEIRYFSSEAAPLSLGIVFDMSHSMQNKLQVAREAAGRFLETGTPEDEYLLVEFASRAELTENFTTDISRLRDRLALKPAKGATALYDAVYLGLAKVRAGQNPKKALLLITDGEDNHSRYSLGDIREFVRESDVQIYIIDLGRSFVSELAEMTGGHSYHGSVDDLEDICTKIALELKSQYVLGYASSNTLKDGKFRKIRMRVTPPPGMFKLSVRSRDGYFAAAN
ncbi:MAG TPA: VWA domain-containing protein [Terriglobia bacterium]|nr:VWA domain-containing protein [Terriglobia bacterium]